MEETKTQLCPALVIDCQFRKNFCQYEWIRSYGMMAQLKDPLKTPRYHISAIGVL